MVSQVALASALSGVNGSPRSIERRCIAWVSSPWQSYIPSSGTSVMSPRISLALQLSRLHAFLMSLSPSRLWQPRRAGFGGVEVYVTVLEKAAVLLERLARNHPLPDGNKRPRSS